MRIFLIVLAQIFLIPGYLFKMEWYGKHATKEKAFNYIKGITKRSVRIGNVHINVKGLDRLPKEDGYILFPNHQGMFDMLVFLDTFPRPFSFVLKKEARNVILLKQVVDSLHSLAMNREDLRQSMKVIQEMTRRVNTGENFLIFAEGTRSREGNKVLDMKGGSFKSAVKAKCPIVPCALYDSFKPFDDKSIKPVTVTVSYLEPIYYDEYKDMTTLEIAAMVKARIENAIAQIDNER